MKRNDILFLGVFTVATLLLGNIIVENYLLTTTVSTKVPVNVDEVKAKINQAGLTPHKAMHWIEIQ